LLKRISPLVKEIEAINDELLNSRESEHFNKLAEERGYFDNGRKLQEIKQEDSLLYESVYFDEEGYKYRIKQLKKAAGSFDSLKSFFTEFLKLYKTVSLVHYQEEGDIQKTPLDTVSTKLVKFENLKIEDIIFLQDDVLLQITR